MDLYHLSQSALQMLTLLLPVALWCAFWLWAVNWKKAWPVLAQGGWAPVVLLMFTITLAWSRIAKEPYDGLGFVMIPSFWWQLGTVMFLVALAFFCGRRSVADRHSRGPRNRPPARKGHDEGRRRSGHAG